MPTDDPLSDLLTLEDTLYTTALSQGISDGARAGRIEGRIFGLEKGFEKFATLGELHGRGAVWGSRLASPPSLSSDTTSTQPSDTASTPAVGKNLPPLTPSQRLTNNTTLLYHLTDPPTFSTTNTEASVADYDDRVKRAGAKVKVIERMVGESSATTTNSSTTTTSTAEEGASATVANAEQRRKVRLQRVKKGTQGGDSMEDFAGSRLIG